MADNQDPLVALQKLLEDQKKAGASPASDPDSPQASADDAAQDAEVKNQEESAPTLSAEEIASLQKTKQEQDEVEIQEQLKRMQTELKDTPQYQARISQKQASEEESQKKLLEERSKRIFQLKHLDP